MITRIATIVSYILHPLFLPTYFFLILFNLNVYINFILPDNVKLLIIGNVVLITFILPFILMLLYKRKGLIISLQMETREERIFPFITIIIFYYLTYYFFKELNLPLIFGRFMLGGMFLVLLCLIINLFWKISLHTTGIGALTGAVFGLSYMFPINLNYLVLILIIISGLSGSSRLALKIHSPSQIYIGFGLGFIFMLSMFMIS